MTLRELKAAIEARREHDTEVFVFDESGKAVPLRLLVDKEDGVYLEGWGRAS